MMELKFSDLWAFWVRGGTGYTGGPDRSKGTGVLGIGDTQGTESTGGTGYRDKVPLLHHAKNW